jgi:hypothetical protein
LVTGGAMTDGPEGGRLVRTFTPSARKPQVREPCTLKISELEPSQVLRGEEARRLRRDVQAFASARRADHELLTRRLGSLTRLDSPQRFKFASCQKVPFALSSPICHAAACSPPAGDVVAVGVVRVDAVGGDAGGGVPGGLGAFGGVFGKVAGDHPVGSAPEAAARP